MVSVLLRRQHQVACIETTPKNSFNVDLPVSLQITCTLNSDGPKGDRYLCGFPFMAAILFVWVYTILLKLSSLAINGFGFSRLKSCRNDQNTLYMFKNMLKCHFRLHYLLHHCDEHTSAPNTPAPQTDVDGALRNNGHQLARASGHLV